MTSQDIFGAPAPTLRDYVQVLKRGLWIVLLMALVAGLAGYYLASRQENQFRATANVLLPTSIAEDAITGGRAVLTNSDLGDRVVYAEQVVVDEVYDRNEVEGEQLQLFVDAANDGTSVMFFTAVSTDAQLAADAANDFATTYVTEQQEQTDADFNEVTNTFKEELNRLSIERTDVRSTLSELQAERLNPQTDEQRAILEAEITNEENRIRDELLNLDAAISKIRADIVELQVSRAFTSGADVNLGRAAQVPFGPFAPNVGRQVQLALIAGLALGVGLVFVREHMDDRVRSVQRLESAVDPLPVIGSIPKRASRDRYELDVVHDPSGPVGEAFRSLRTSLQLSAAAKDLKVILVTSANPSEGKTTVSANLAVALANAGQQVVLIDADLRRPRLQKLFGIEDQLGPEDGLTHQLLSGELTMGVQLEGFPNVNLIPAGPRTVDPPELLMSDSMDVLLDALRDKVDHVIIDAPPVLPVSDARILAGMVDAVVIVVNAVESRRDEVRRSLRLMGEADGNLLGSVLVAAREEDSDYRYHYRYAEPSSSGRKLWPFG